MLGKGLEGRGVVADRAVFTVADGVETCAACREGRLENGGDECAAFDEEIEKVCRGVEKIVHRNGVCRRVEERATQEGAHGNRRRLVDAFHQVDGDDRDRRCEARH